MREVRRYYPSAPIIRIERDPRDVALFLPNVPWRSSSFVAAVLQWQCLDELGASFFETDHNCLTLRFEDLVMNPESELRRLCDFIGEQFEPSMMNTSQSITHVNPTKIPRKQNTSAFGVSPLALAVAKEEAVDEAARCCCVLSCD